MHACTHTHTNICSRAHTHKYIHTHLCMLTWTVDVHNFVFQVHVDLVPPPSCALAALDTEESIVAALEARLLAMGEQKLRKVSAGQRVQVLWTDASGREEKWVAQVDEVRLSAQGCKERGVRVVWLDKKGRISTEHEPYFLPVLDLQRKLFLPGDEGCDPAAGRSILESMCKYCCMLRVFFTRDR